MIPAKWDHHATKRVVGLGSRAVRRLRRSVRTLGVQLLITFYRIRGFRVVCWDVRFHAFIHHVAPIHRELVGRTTVKCLSLFAVSSVSKDGVRRQFRPPHRWMVDYSSIVPLRGVDVFITPNNWDRGPDHSYAIHITHGHPAKYHTYRQQDLCYFDEWFLTGPIHEVHVDRMLHAAAEDRVPRVVTSQIGLPKSDALQQGRFDRSAVVQSLDLDPARYTVLYAPSWEAESSLRHQDWGGVLIDSLRQLDINILVRLHPVSYLPRHHPDYEKFTGGRDWVSELAPSCGSGRVVHVVKPDYQIDPLLEAADCLVTDFSSVALEFHPLGKPVIYLDCPDFANMVRRHSGDLDLSDDEIVGNPAVNAGRHLGSVADSPVAAARLIARMSTEPRTPASPSSDLRDAVLFNPGGASHAAASRLEKLLRSPARPGTQKE